MGGALVEDVTAKFWVDLPGAAYYTCEGGQGVMADSPSTAAGKPIGL